MCTIIDHDITEELRRSLKPLTLYKVLRVVPHRTSGWQNDTGFSVRTQTPFTDSLFGGVGHHKVCPDDYEYDTENPRGSHLYLTRGGAEKSGWMPTSPFSSLTTICEVTVQPQDVLAAGWPQGVGKGNPSYVIEVVARAYSISYEQWKRCTQSIWAERAKRCLQLMQTDESILLVECRIK